jgi:hypothetical protein
VEFGRNQPLPGGLRSNPKGAFYVSITRPRPTRDALNLVSGRQRADLNSDQMLLFALVRAIEVVGEAASK